MHASGPGADRPRYLPAEDTALLGRALEPFRGGSCLEIGFGSGAVLAGVAPRFVTAVGTDVIGLEEARLGLSPKVEVVLADRATCFRDSVFDLVYFNPPYLPSEKVEDRAVDGGPSGIEVACSFLEDGERVLKEGGTVVVLLSEEGDVDSFVARARALGLKVEVLRKERLFYETLVVFKLVRE